jgi:hypothetical protein
MLRVLIALSLLTTFSVPVIASDVQFSSVEQSQLKLPITSELPFTLELPMTKSLGLDICQRTVLKPPKCIGIDFPGVDTVQQPYLLAR